MSVSEYGVSSHGIKLSVLVPKVTDPEAGVIVKLILTNSDAASIRYMPAFEAMPVFRINFQDEEGNRVPYAEGDALRLRKFLSAQVLTGYGKAIELEPGEQREWSFDLSKFYEIRSGTFEIALMVPFESQPFPDRFRGKEHLRVEGVSIDVE